MLKQATVFLVASAGLLAFAAHAYADDDADYDTSGYDTTYSTYESPGPYSYAWTEPYLPSEIGVGVNIGGGVAGFTDKAMRDTLSSNVEGLWDARVAIGTHIPLGLELGYVGTAQDINTINGFSNGTLVGSTAEAALRFNILPHNDFTPFIFGGAGWTHYAVRNMSFATADSGMKSSDDVAEFPMGAGLSYRDVSGLTVDVRGTFRAAASSDLLIDPRTGNEADLHTWEASAALGYEF